MFGVKKRRIRTKNVQNVITLLAPVHFLLVPTQGLAISHQSLLTADNKLALHIACKLGNYIELRKLEIFTSLLKI